MEGLYEVRYSCTTTEIETVRVKAASFEEAEKAWFAMAADVPYADLFKITAPDGRERIYD